MKTIKTHARVCSALTYSVLQCPGVMPGFTGDGVWAHLVAYAYRDETSPGPAMDYGPRELKKTGHPTLARNFTKC